MSPQPAMRYLLSLPERALRAAAAALGGLLYEAASLTLPASLRRTRLYQAIVARALRITIEAVGQVHDSLPPDTMGAQELVYRKAAGNVIEAAAFLALGWSPLWLLAAVADLTGGTRTYLAALVAELQQAGALPANADIATVDQLLNTLETTSGAMADAVDVPPLNVHALRQSWQALRQNAADLPDAGRLARLYDQLQHLARAEGRSLAAVSGLLALSAMRAGVQLGQTHIFDHYRASFQTIQAEGFRAYTRRVTRPYLAAAAGHFQPGRETSTDRLLKRLFPRQGG